ncbi:hypothetical protein SMD11_1269 [Streptomyces albireticuli]|uniref:Uncharacterized protein n=1 Tax=Streptomyces albireticuli TaxID=1940 RepID=A0A1Z2KY27_9ACTN|nr:hypothetical protein [Streptomyces albireticuli]ARZ66930.1 hypothetical protein SMD11_1269 [Streptomyces albireticuli]
MNDEITRWQVEFRLKGEKRAVARPCVLEDGRNPLEDFPRMIAITYTGTASRADEVQIIAIRKAAPQMGENLTRYPCPVEDCESFLEISVPMWLDIWTDGDGVAHFTIAGNDAPTYFTCGAEKAHSLLDFPAALVDQVMARLNVAETAMYEEQYG